MRSAGLNVLDADAGYPLCIAENLLQDVVPAHRDVASIEEFFLENLLRSEFVSAVDHGDPARNIGEVERFLHRGVPAADDGDVLALVEESVAGRTGGDALSHEPFLGLEPEIAG